MHAVCTKYMVKQLNNKVNQNKISNFNFCEINFFDIDDKNSQNVLKHLEYAKI